MGLTDPKNIADLVHLSPLCGIHGSPCRGVTSLTDVSISLDLSSSILIQILISIFLSLRVTVKLVIYIAVYKPTYVIYYLHLRDDLFFPYFK